MSIKDLLGDDAKEKITGNLSQFLILVFLLTGLLRIVMF